DVHLSLNVADVGGKLGDIVEKSALSRRPLGCSVHHRRQWLVVTENHNFASLDHETEVLDCHDDGQKLAVECRISLLSGLERLGEESKWAPDGVAFSFLL